MLVKAIPYIFITFIEGDKRIEVDGVLAKVCKTSYHVAEICGVVGILCEPIEYSFFLSLIGPGSKIRYKRFCSVSRFSMFVFGEPKVQNDFRSFRPIPPCSLNFCFPALFSPSSSLPEKGNIPEWILFIFFGIGLQVSPTYQKVCPLIQVWQLFLFFFVDDSKQVSRRRTYPISFLGSAGVVGSVLGQSLGSSSSQVCFC